VITHGAEDREVAVRNGIIWIPRLMSALKEGDVFFPFPRLGPVPKDPMMWAVALADAHQEPDVVVGDFVWSVRARWGVVE
jgi:hypothetical protein